MEVEKIESHVSADEHLLRISEEQLLKDGRQWLSRAADLYTQTPKIKIWVPVLGSMLITGYYLFNIHAAIPAERSLPQVQSAPPAAVAVADDAALPKSAIPPPTVSGGLDPQTVESGDSDSELLKQAQQARSDQQFANEAALLQKVLDHSKSPQNVCPAIGKAYERAGEIDSAIRAFDRCISMLPGDADTLVAFAHVLQAKPDYKRAASEYRLCLQQDPGNLDAQTGMALLELRQNHLDKAGHAALAILQKAPNNTDALLIAGLTAWRQGRLTDAEKTFSRGVGIDDHRADFHAFLGRIAEAQQRPQDALQQYERALTLDPADSDITDRRNRLRDAK